MIKGLPQLRARMEAIKPSPKLMRELALQAVAEQKRLVVRKTGNLGRSINVGRVTSTSAETIARAGYAAFVEFGTKPHIIVPRRKKVLRFTTGGSGKGGAVVFAKRVRHPGTRAQPFMLPGAEKAIRSLGVDFIVKLWNRAG